MSDAPSHKTVFSFGIMTAITCSALIYQDAIFTVGNLTSLQNKRTSLVFLFCLWAASRPLAARRRNLPQRQLQQWRSRKSGCSLQQNRSSLSRYRTHRGAYCFNRLHLPSLSYWAIFGLCDQYSSVCSNNSEESYINVYTVNLYFHITFTISGTILNIWNNVQ